MQQFENNQKSKTSKYRSIIIPNFNTMEEYNDFIEDLTKKKQELVSKSLFNDAEEIKLKIIDAKSYFTKEKRDHFKNKQQKEVEGVSAEFQNKINYFELNWKKEFEQFGTKSKLAIEKLQKKNDDDMRRLSNEIDKDAKNIKYSNHYLKLIELKEKLIAKEKYIEAEKIKNKIISIRESEIDKYIKIQLTRYNDQVTRLTKVHLNELDKLKKKIEMEKLEMERKRVDELHNLTFSYKSRKIELDVKQRHEKKEFESEINIKDMNKSDYFSDSSQANSHLRNLSKSANFKTKEFLSSKLPENSLLSQEVTLLTQFHDKWKKFYFEFETRYNNESELLKKRHEDELKNLKNEVDKDTTHIKFSNHYNKLLDLKSTLVDKLNKLEFYDESLKEKLDELEIKITKQRETEINNYISIKISRIDTQIIKLQKQQCTESRNFEHKFEKEKLELDKNKTTEYDELNDSIKAKRKEFELNKFSNANDSVVKDKDKKLKHIKNKHNDEYTDLIADKKRISTQNSINMEANSNKASVNNTVLPNIIK